MADIAIFRVNYKSDFIITLESDAGWSTPFCIKFWTDSPQRAFYVQYDGETYTHCAPVAGEPTKLMVQMDDHHLGIGNLQYQIAYHFTVADFPNDTEDEVLNQAAVIINEDGQQEQVMLDLNGETAPEIAFSLPAYANEQQRIANEQQRIANEEVRIANEEQRIIAEQQRITNENQRISNEEARVSEFARLKRESEAATQDATDAAVLATTAADLATAKAQLAQDAATLANQKAQLAADKAALAAAAADLATAKAQLAQEKATYAQTQGDYAKAQGDYAKAQGDTAQADHVRAEADHTTAADDHSRAEGDHTTAASDHTRAESDHTQAGADHTRAESDHTTAAADHTTAQADHTRAESDHTAVEMYVDSLGVFDLSKHNAVGGVLATYADLDAALNALNALDSKYKYGGMSFKFVQSSDNNYVQSRYMGTSTADADFTNVNNWQGVDEVPTAESQNLVTSGGTLDKIISEGTYSKGQAIIPNLNYENSLLPTGYWSTSEGLIVKGYKVTAGTILYLNLSKDGQSVCQFQSANSVIDTAYKRNSYVKRIYDNAINSYVKVPESATYLFVCQNTSNTNNQVILCTKDVDAAPVKDSPNFITSGAVKGALALETDLDVFLGTCKKTGGTHYSGAYYVLNSELEEGKKYVLRLVSNTDFTGGNVSLRRTASSTGQIQVIASNVVWKAGVPQFFDFVAEGTGKYILIGNSTNEMSFSCNAYEIKVIDDYINYDTYLKIFSKTVGEHLTNAYYYTEDVLVGGHDYVLKLISDTAFTTDKISLRRIASSTGQIQDITSNVVWEVNVPQYFRFTAQGSGNYLLIGNSTNEMSFVCEVYDVTVMSETGIIRLNGGNNITGTLDALITPSPAAATTLMSLLWFSDVHGNASAVKRILEFNSSFGEGFIADMIHTGDSVYNYAADGMVAFDQEGAEKILNVVGNHDSRQGDSMTGFGQKNTYDMVIAPYVSNWGVVQPANAAINGLSYYYKDYANINIRLIVLDCMFYDSDQNTWLINILSDALTNNKSVVIANHYAGGSITKINNCTFNTLVYAQPSASISADASAAVADFITNGGDFICWMGGHTHNDFIGTLTNHPEQLNINICTANPASSGSDTPREVGAKSQDLFNIISFNIAEKLIKIWRVGADRDVYLRHKATLCIDYSTKEVIWND